MTDDVDVLARQIVEGSPRALAPELGDAEVAGVPGHRPAPNDR